MELAIPKKMTVQDYLDFEDPDGLRYEFDCGRLIAMAGGTDVHSTISTNTLTELTIRLRGGSCRVYNNDIKIRIPAKPRYRYADGLVVCGATEVEKSVKGKKVVIVNPKLIFEVLSESTEAQDRGVKFADYLTIDSLRQYVLISQLSPRVETFLRQEDGSWKFETFQGIDAVARFEAIGILVPLAEIYRDVDFPDDDDSEADA